MRALTLWQPWAFAIAHLDKMVENRDWLPDVRLLDQHIAIHAGKRLDADAVEDLRAEGFGVPDALTGSAVVAVARLVGLVEAIDDATTGVTDCHVIESAIPTAAVREMALAHDGLWLNGRFGWVLGDRRPLAQPVPCRGAQGLWFLPPDVEALVRERAGL